MFIVYFLGIMKATIYLTTCWSGWNSMPTIWKHLLKKEQLITSKRKENVKNFYTSYFPSEFLVFIQFKFRLKLLVTIF